MSAKFSALGISVTAVSAISTVRPRASTSETPITRWPGLGSMQRRMSSSATEKLRVTPVTMASASPSATMQAAKWLRSWLTRRWTSRCRKPWRCSRSYRKEGDDARAFAHAVLAADQQCCAEALVDEVRGGADHLLFLALGKDDALGSPPQPLV